MGYFDAAVYTDDPEISRMLVEVEMVRQQLIACSITPGAKVTIRVEHDNGNVVSAKLYDHAALVTLLIDALDYFQSELI